MGVTLYDLWTKQNCADITTWEAYHKAKNEGREEAAEEAYAKGQIVSVYGDE